MKHRSIHTVAELSIYVALAFIFGYLEKAGSGFQMAQEDILIAGPGP